MIVSTPIEYTPPEPNAALVVGPDDQLVVVVPRDIEPQELRPFVRELGERFGDRVTVLCGPDGIAVLRAGDVPAMHPDSRACDQCRRKYPDQFAAFPTLCAHVAMDGEDAMAAWTTFRRSRGR